MSLDGFVVTRARFRGRKETRFFSTHASRPDDQATRPDRRATARGSIDETRKRRRDRRQTPNERRRKAESSRLLTTVKTRPRNEAHTLTTRTRDGRRRRRASPPSNAPPPLGSRRAPPPRLKKTTHQYSSPPAIGKECIRVRIRRTSADSLAGVGQETLNQGDLLTANLALTAQALLVARGHVGVQVLLPRAPVQNLFRGEKGERRSGQRLGRGAGERAAPRASRRRASGASVSCERGYANGNGRVTIGASASWFPIRARAG